MIITGDQLALGTTPHLESRITIQPPAVPFNSALFIQGVPGQEAGWPNNDYMTVVNADGHTVFSVEGQGTLTAAAQTTTARVFNFDTKDNPTVVGLITNASHTKEIEFRGDFAIRTGEASGDRAVMGGDVVGFQITRRDSGGIVFHVSNYLDSSNRYQMNGNGRQSWGAGGSANQDTVLERQGGGGGLHITPSLGVGCVAPAAGIDATAYRANGTPGLSTSVVLGAVTLTFTNGLLTAVT